MMTFVPQKRFHGVSSFRCDSGFTLVEVMVTMVIFSITSMGLALLMVSMIGSNGFANNFSQANRLAEDKLEELKNECCLVVEPGTDTIDKFNRTWTFVDNNPVSGLIKVQVTVSWSDGYTGEDHGEHHATTLVALMLPY